MEICYLIRQLINYGIKNHLITSLDKIVVQNSLMEIFALNEWKFEENVVRKMKDDEIHTILKKLCDYAVKKEIINDSINSRDLFDTKLMGLLTPSQGKVNKEFYQIAKKKKMVKATEWYYNFSQKTNYIRMDRINKNIKWFTKTEYGKLEITINLSKPEKDPRDIAIEKNAPKLSYPKCLLCYENVGYSGRVNHPARQNHRVIEVKISKDKDERWFLQYSPYVYYNEHAIVFSCHHRPMKININTFQRLLEFVGIFSHYFLGSNADLPIVGGSILSHDHYQGGHHNFPMEFAPIEKIIKFKGYPLIKAGILKWPMSVIRLQGRSRNKLAILADKILRCWREYNDIENNILAFTDDVPHNTITPIARNKNGYYEIDLVLRNNRTTEEYPLGIFHPHKEVQNIKKENIGLIEVMGLAVLPGRLKEELKILEKYMILESWKEVEKKIIEDENVKKHLNWAKEIYLKYKNISSATIEDILKKEVGNAFMIVLEHSGVFKKTVRGKLGFEKFLEYINNSGY
ncbi:UDP-glucose--hexose-1-phosphate uridylyltransferase [Fusobacterium sp. PH5-44]|uniref:UDP-glucose--hexose-1-phosphate uridylyltransferase n=1 Tax=unclassified Fusobacterium TaxID=2648384 RepID=UPI003D24C76C